MNCKICGCEVRHVFSNRVLKKHHADYFKCNSCGYLFADNPFWLSEAYENTITHADTGLLSRNIGFSRQIAVLIYHLFRRDGRYLDYGGGYGVFTRLMRDAGFEFYHIDPYTENLFARELAWDQSSKMDGVTCFECFEHFADPMSDIRRIVAISKTVFFTTALLPEEVPPVTWDYYGFDHGQHISFYAAKTLDCIARQLDLSVVSSGNFHIFTPEPVSRRSVRALAKKSNRISHIFSRRTTFEAIVRKMRKRAMHVAP